MIHWVLEVRTNLTFEIWSKTKLLGCVIPTSVRGPPETETRRNLSKEAINLSNNATNYYCTTNKVRQNFKKTPFVSPLSEKFSTMIDFNYFSMWLVVQSGSDTFKI